MGILEGKNAIIYGGGGSIGGATARAFAREGARVFLAGRTQATLDAVANGIGAETAIVDATDAAQVDAHADEVAHAAGSIDVSLNVIAHPYAHGTSVLDLDVDVYVEPVEFVTRTTFITARAAGRHMAKQGAGVILSFGGTGYPLRDYAIGGTQLAFDAVESMRRQFSAELGRQGVRWITLITGGVPESAPPEVAEAMAAGTMTGRAATLEDVGNTMAFAASDWARSLTAATINISDGDIVDF